MEFLVSFNHYTLFKKRMMGDLQIIELWVNFLYMGKRKQAIIGSENLKEKEINFGNIVRLYKSDDERKWKFCYLCGYLYSFTKGPSGFILISQVKDFDKTKGPEVTVLFQYECLLLYSSCFFSPSFVVHRLSRHADPPTKRLLCLV